MHHFQEEANIKKKRFWHLKVNQLLVIFKVDYYTLIEVENKKDLQWRKSTGDALLFLIRMATAAGAQKQVVAKWQAAAP